MKPITFITGNQRKADYLARWLKLPMRHHKLDLDELQSLDPRTVAEHKARQAYDILKEPVLIEDVSLVFTAMGRLPGTFVKWFLEEIGTEGLCKIADGLPHRKAVATITYAFCDGKQVHFFDESLEGTVAPKPRGEHGMGWDPIFIPKGLDKTLAEMTIDQIEPISPRARAIRRLQTFLEKQEQ